MWPWFSLCLLCVFVIGFSSLTLWPWGYPARDELIETGGDIKKFSVRDQISDAPTVWSLPALVSVYITFKNREGEFEYPWSHPKYAHVRDKVGARALILVRESDLDGPGPYKIWALEEQNTYKPEEDQVLVSYEEIAGTLEQQAQTLGTSRKWLGITAVLFALYGAYTIRWNRRNYPDWYQ